MSDDKENSKFNFTKSTERKQDKGLLLLDAKYRDIYVYFDQKLSSKKEKKPYHILSYTDIRKQYFYGLILLAKHQKKTTDSSEPILVHNAMIFPVSEHFQGGSKGSDAFLCLRTGFRHIADLWLEEKNIKKSDKPSIAILAVNLLWLMQEYIQERTPGRHHIHYQDLWNETAPSEFHSIDQLF